jgi:TRAP-type C4-dicarboxylate transport system substrate-binding protein
MSKLQKLLKAVGCAAAVATAAFSAPAPAADHVVWRLAHTLSVPRSLYEKIIIEEIPARLAKATDGYIQIRPLIGVISTDDVINALRRDRVQMGDLTVAYSAATYPMWAVLNLPGLVDDPAYIAPISRKLVQPEMARDMEPMGIRPAVIVSWDGGAYFSNKPIRKIEDFKGLQWRTHAPMLSQIIVEMGGTTVGMPFGELIPSLEKGLVQAYTTTFPAMDAAGLPKVTKYAIAAPNGTSLAVVMVSEKALQALPEDVRKKAVAELDAINAEVGERLYKDMLAVVDSVQKQGVELITFTPEESAKVRAASQKAVWSEWLQQTGDRGKALVEKIQAYKRAMTAGGDIHNDDR